MAASQPSLYTNPMYRTHLCKCSQKSSAKCAPSRVSFSLTFMAASQPSLYTNPVYRTHLCKCSQKRSAKWGRFPQKAPQMNEFPKSGMNRGRFVPKSGTMNEPPLGCHHRLPSRLLRSQVCTQTQCLEPISVSVPKKWREMGEIPLKKPHKRMSPL